MKKLVAILTLLSLNLSTLCSESTFLKPRVTTLECPYPVTKVAFNPRENNLAFISGSKVPITDTQGNLLNFFERPEYHERMGEPVDQLAFTPDGKKIAFNTTIGNIKVFNNETKEEYNHITCGGEACSLSFTPDSNYVAVGFDNKDLVKIHKIGNSKKNTTCEYNEMLVQAQFSPDGKIVAAATSKQLALAYFNTTSDGTCNIKNCDTIAISKYSGIERICFGPHNLLALSYQNQGDIGRHITILKYTEPTQSFFPAIEDYSQKSIEHGLGIIFALHISPDGKSIVSSQLNENTAKVSDTLTGKTNYTIQHKAAVITTLFSPDGKFLGTGSYDKTAKITDAHTGQILHTFNFTNSVPSVDFSFDSRYFAAGSEDKTVKIVDLYNSGSGKKIVLFEKKQEPIEQQLPPVYDSTIRKLGAFVAHYWG